MEKNVSIHFGTCGKSAFDRVHLGTVVCGPKKAILGEDAGKYAEYLRDMGYYTVIEKEK